MKNGDTTEVPLAVVGCDFRTAPSRWRSRLVLDQNQVKQISRRLKRNDAADGFCDLNTCNRNEWIVSSSDPHWATELLRTQMIQRAGPEAIEWLRPYVFTGEEAARHVFRVAIGQESLVIGERQIAGQLQRALETARARGTSSRILNGLGTVAGRLVRIALRRGCIEHAAVGVHSLAVSYLEHRFEGDGSQRVAVVGLGRIGRRVLGVLEQIRRFETIGCTRTVGKGQSGRIFRLDQLAEVLQNVDAAVVCTGAQRPLILTEHFSSRPEDRPLLLVDIGIPNQVEKNGVPSRVEVIDLDDLTAFHRCQMGLGQDRRLQDEEADGLIRRALDEFKTYCNEQTFSKILDTVQKHHRQLVGEEIPRLIAGRFKYLPDETRFRLESDLKNIVLEYTNEVFRTIKETSKRNQEDHECLNGP